LTPNAISARLCGRAAFFGTYATRWDLHLADRDCVFGFLSQVLDRHIEVLGREIDPFTFLRTAAPAAYS
jgi:hypothetical protein